MLTRLDHMMICVPDLAAGIETYRRIGFDVHPGGAHTGRSTENAIAFFTDDYLELLGLRADPRVTPPVPGSSEARLAEFLARGGGLRYIAIQSDDLGGDVAAMRGRGVDVSEPSDGARTTPAGLELRWRAAALGPQNPLPIFFIQHLTPLAERRRQVPRPGEHPNGAVGAQRAYIVVPDVAASAIEYGRVLGLPVPPVQRGGVIKADMAVFDLGPTGLGIAQPAEPGPAAEALARRGPGPFQVLYRARSLDAAADWMTSRGLPRPARGVRNTGEQAMLVAPEHAGGLYVGFFGPP